MTDQPGVEAPVTEALAMSVGPTRFCHDPACPQQRFGAHAEHVSSGLTVEALAEAINDAFPVIYAEPFKYSDGHLTAVVKDEAAHLLAAAIFARLPTAAGLDE